MFTDTQLLEHLVDVCSSADSTVSRRQYRQRRDDRHASFQTIKRRFGGWNKAKKAAGLDTLESGDAKSLTLDYFEELDPENAYWLGFLYGDGWISGEEYPSLGLEISKKDEEHLRRFREDVGSSHAITEKEEKVSVTITRPEFCQHLKEQNLRKDKTFDDSLPGLSEGLLPHFVRGLFDADGHVADCRHLRIYGYGPRLLRIAEQSPFDPVVEQQTGKETSVLVVRADIYDDWIEWMYPEGEETDPKLGRKSAER
jgi:hypothetical protein